MAGDWIPPMWPGFDTALDAVCGSSFNVSLLYSKRFLLDAPVSPLPWKTNTGFALLKASLFNVIFRSSSLRETKQTFHLHREVWVLLVILKHIPDSLVNHGKQRFQSAHARKVHDVFLVESKLQAFDHQSIRREVFLDDVHKITLNLKWKRFYFNANIRR